MARQDSPTTVDDTEGRRAHTFSLDFPAEIKEVKSKKLASLDISYRVVLETNDPTVLNLGALDADVMLNVSMEIAS